MAAGLADCGVLELLCSPTYSGRGYEIISRYDRLDTHFGTALIVA